MVTARDSRGLVGHALRAGRATLELAETQRPGGPGARIFLCLWYLTRGRAKRCPLLTPRGGYDAG